LILVRRHFFLVGAVVLLALMLVLGGVKLALGHKKAGGEPVAAAALGATKTRGGPAAGAGVPQVTQAVAAMHTFTDRVEVLGVAKGRQSVTLTSNNSELIAKVNFLDGQAVARVAVLVELKASEQDAELIQAKAALIQAKANYDRWHQLFLRGIAAQASDEQYRSLYQQAQAGVQAAASRKMDRMIRAPFSGVVGLSDVAPGALISPGTPIVTLDDLAVIRVDFSVPDRYLAILRVGMPISARADAYPQQVIAGRIAQIDSRVDQHTRAVIARAEFPNPDRRLKPGMQMRVSIEQNPRQGIAVPEAAVQFEGDSASVYVIARRGPQLIAEKRLIQAGDRSDGLVEVRQGLAVGEPVVADGVNRITADRPVRMAPAARSRPGTGGPPPAGAARP
jgi:membrane fusion protein (multidrug efflux system)